MTEPKAPEQVEVTPAPAEPTQVVIRKQPKALSQRDPMQIAEAFYASGFFPDVKSKAQAVVKIIAGESLGLDPYAAIDGLTIIEGKLGFKANLVATLVMQHERYRYEVKETTNERCVIEFYDGEDLRGVSEFTLEDAECAELIKPRGNWAKYPKAMCFNRALTQGVRAYIPDVTAGAPAYTDEEIEEVISEQPVAEVAEASAPILDPECVEHLAKGYELAKPSLEANGVNALDGFNLLLGSLGIDGFNPNDSLPEQLAKLTEEQAEKLDAELQELVDQEDGGSNAE